ncbi:MAG: response regulator [Spirochaetales bacterium]|nr:response regulator [Spirochaetales bacterium]
MKKKILILEEDNVLSFVLKKSLEKLGYYAVAANNEAQVLSLFRQEKNIDLFLFDFFVKGSGNNVGILAKLRQSLPELKAVAVSGTIIENWAKYEIQGLLIKPYAIQELDVMLKNIFSEKSNAKIQLSY